MARARAVLVEDALLLPAWRRVDPDRRARERDQLVRRALDLDRMGVVVLDRISPWFGWEREQVTRVVGKSFGQLEDREYEYEELTGALTGVYRHHVLYLRTYSRS